jgi:hypothetical protein
MGAPNADPHFVPIPSAHRIESLDGQLVAWKLPDRNAPSVAERCVHKARSDALGTLLRGRRHGVAKMRPPGRIVLPEVPHAAGTDHAVVGVSTPDRVPLGIMGGTPCGTPEPGAQHPWPIRHTPRSVRAFCGPVYQCHQIRLPRAGRRKTQTCDDENPSAPAGLGEISRAVHST